jgi:hypothetical protein
MKKIELPKLDLGAHGGAIPMPDLGLVKRPAEEADDLAAATEAIERLETDFQKRAREENQRFEDATDSEYWIALCFQTREQKEEFLKKLDLLDLGDKYLDGRAVADKLGVQLDSETPKWREGKKNRRLTELT